MQSVKYSTTGQVLVDFTFPAAENTCEAWRDILTYQIAYLKQYLAWFEFLTERWR